MLTFAYYFTKMKSFLSACLLLLVCFASNPFISFSQSHSFFPEKFKKDVPLLILFSGSDWCAACIRFEKKVLHQNAFTDYISGKLNFYIADFPQSKKITNETKQRNDSLAEQYNPMGIFPLLVLLYPDGRAFAYLQYRNESAEEFVKMIQEKISEKKSLREFRKREKLMGSDFELILTHESELYASHCLHEGVNEIKRIERLLTEFSETSETSRINSSAGKEAVEVSEETYLLLGRCIEISKLSQGAFDITVSPLKNIFKFKNNYFRMPEQYAINDALSKTGFRNVELMNDHRVRLKKEGMRLSFAAIGKGYASDKTKSLLEAKGIESGCINASGDLTVWGRRHDGSLWKVGIANPEKPEEILFFIPLQNCSVATSGDYLQHFYFEGKRYSHNINPKTGKPLTGIKSVTVINKSAELCDALCTAVYVMGVDVGLHFIRQLPSTHCIIVDENNHFHFSEKIKPDHA